MTQSRISQEEYPYFVTICIKESIPLFEKTRYAELLFKIIFKAGQLKKYNVVSYQIMPDHVHLLIYGNRDRNLFLWDRTLESVRSERNMKSLFTKSERTFSKVRSHNNQARSRDENQFTISDLMQSSKGNFSRKVHQGNIWQKRFYIRIVYSNKYLATVIYYIKQNPFKEELPMRYQRLPYQYFNCHPLGDPPVGGEKINELF